MGDKSLILLGPYRRTVGKRGNRIAQEVGAQLRQLGRKLVGGLARHRAARLGTIGTGIHTVPDAHDGNAGAIVTSDDRALDGSGTAPARQKRRVHVHDTERRHMQDVVGQDAPVGGNAEDIGVGLAQAIHNLGRDASGLHHRDIELQGCRLDRRRLELLSATAHGIGSREHQDHLETQSELAQGRHGEIGRAHEDNAHSCAPFQMLLRLAGLGTASARLLIIVEGGNPLAGS